MTTDFFRFPHTPHLAWLGEGSPRDDKVMSLEIAQDFLDHPVVAEEKVDGANLGVSIDEAGTLRVQNRGAYLNSPMVGQFTRLGEWLSRYHDPLSASLGNRLILFGEWCAAQHSLDYNRLPGWFVGFDVYDRNENRFWSTGRRNDLLCHLGIPAIRQIQSGPFTLVALKDLLQKIKSQYRDGGVEGIILRWEDDQWLRARCKLVHPHFTQAIGEHWSRKRIQWNQVGW